MENHKNSLMIKPIKLNETIDSIFGNSSLLFNEGEKRTSFINLDYNRINLRIKNLAERSISLCNNIHLFTIARMEKIIFPIKEILNSSWDTWHIIATLNAGAQCSLVYYLHSFLPSTFIYTYIGTIFYMAFTKKIFCEISNFSSLKFYENLFNKKNILLLPLLIFTLCRLTNDLLNNLNNRNSISTKTTNAINLLNYFGAPLLFIYIINSTLLIIQGNKEEAVKLEKEMRNWYSSLSVPSDMALAIIFNNKFSIHQLAKFYEKSGKTNSSIKYYERILTIENNDKKTIKHTLKKLKKLYTLNEDSSGLVKCYKKYLLNYREIPKENFIFNILKFFKNIPISEVSEKLEFLMKNEELWIGKFQPHFTFDEWKHIIESKDYLKQIGILYQRHIAMPKNMDKNLFLNDPTMPKWNVLVQPEEDVDDNTWELNKILLSNIADGVKITNENKRLSMVKFLSQCMLTADARHSATGLQMVRKRVVAIVDYLNALNLKLEKSNDPAENELLKKQIEGGLKIMIDGGSACPDRTDVCLTNLENYIKLLQNPKYLPNIMVLMYKFEIIKDYLTDPTQAENLETFLYNCLSLNEVIGLGLKKPGQIQQQMLYSDLAQKMPVMQMLERLNPGFNIEGALQFTAVQEIFKSIYEQEMTVDQSVMDAGYTFLEADDEHQAAVNSKAPQAEIDELYRKAHEEKLKWENAKHEFYISKAKALFEEAEFIKAEL